MKITSELTDMAVLHEMGDRLESRRIDAGYDAKPSWLRKPASQSAQWSG